MENKDVVWLHGEVRSPPFSSAARVEAGHNLRRLQQGELLTMPISRPMPIIGRRCHELRVNDGTVTWRILYRIDPDAIVVLAVFEKKTPKTPPNIIETSKRRLANYDMEA